MTIFASLHDAVLESICLNWQDGSISIVCLPNDYYKLKRTKLTFLKVKNLVVPRLEEWGPSIYINEVTQQPGSISIEMQSGDVIKIDYLEEDVEVVEVPE